MLVLDIIQNEEVELLSLDGQKIMVTWTKSNTSNRIRLKIAAPKNIKIKRSSPEIKRKLPDGYVKLSSHE